MKQIVFFCNDNSFDGSVTVPIFKKTVVTSLPFFMTKIVLKETLFLSKKILNDPILWIIGFCV